MPRVLLKISNLMEMSDFIAIEKWEIPNKGNLTKPRFCALLNDMKVQLFTSIFHDRKYCSLDMKSFPPANIFNDASASHNDAAENIICLNGPAVLSKNGYTTERPLWACNAWQTGIKFLSVGPWVFFPGRPSAPSIWHKMWDRLANVTENFT